MTLSFSKLGSPFKFEPDLVNGFAHALIADVGLSTDKVVYIEKDVWLTLMLHELYSQENASNELVFKGGTCLVKCYYGFFRFSEDLDFTWVGKKENDKINRRLFRRKYVDPMIHELQLGFEETPEILKGVRHSQSGRLLNYFFVIERPGASDMMKVKLNVSFIEPLLFPIESIEIKPLHVSKGKKRELIGLFGPVAKEYFRSVIVSAYSKKEIACEKVRALLTRKEKLNRSRDVVDLLYLSKDVDLKSAEIIDGCMNKLNVSLKIPAYKTVLKKRLLEVDTYLSHIVEYTKEEPIYISPIDYGALRKFKDDTLKPLIEHLKKKLP